MAANTTTDLLLDLWVSTEALEGVHPLVVWASREVVVEVIFCFLVYLKMHITEVKYYKGSMCKIGSLIFQTIFRVYDPLLYLITTCMYVFLWSKYISAFFYLLYHIRNLHTYCTKQFIRSYDDCSYTERSVVCDALVQGRFLHIWLKQGILSF